MTTLLFQCYSRCLARRPLITNCITSSVSIMSGDMICQTLIETEKPFDKQRTVRFGLYGLLIQAPIVRGWYVTLDRLFPVNNKKSAIKKLLCDLTFFRPFIQAVGLVSIEFMKSQSLQKVKENYLRNFKDLMLNAYKVWPLAQTINFFLIPLKFRLVFGALVSFFWNIYFTWKVNQ